MFVDVFVDVVVDVSGAQWASVLVARTARFPPSSTRCPTAPSRVPLPVMRVVVTSLAVALLAGCPSDPIDCRDLGRVEGPADNCVCPEPLVPVPTDHPDYPGCECPAGTIPSGDTCVLPDGGPDDAGTDAGPMPEEDGCVPVTLHRDADGDGRGDPDVTTTACPGLAGHVENADDCDDACAVCWEGATETCDESDNDCDGFVDEGVREFVGERVSISAENGASADLLQGKTPVVELAEGGVLIMYRTSEDGLAVAELDDSLAVVATSSPEPGELNHGRMVRNGENILLVYERNSTIRVSTRDASTGEPLNTPRTILDVTGLYMVEAAPLASGFFVAYVDGSDRLWGVPVRGGGSIGGEPFLLGTFPVAALTRHIALVPFGERIAIVSESTAVAGRVAVRWVGSEGAEGPWVDIPGLVGATEFQVSEGNRFLGYITTDRETYVEATVAEVAVEGDDITFAPFLVRRDDHPSDGPMTVRIGRNEFLAIRFGFDATSNFVDAWNDESYFSVSTRASLSTPQPVRDLGVAYLEDTNVEDAPATLVVRRLGCAP